MNNPLYNFPNRFDCFGLYKDDGTALTSKETLTNEILDKHIKGEITIGLHSTNPKTNTCKWGMIDIDDEKLDLKKTFTAATVIWDILMTEYNIIGWIDFSGRKGYHVGFKCQETDATYVFNVLTEVRRKAQERLGFEIGGENYPKQPNISSDGYGNWIKMPLGIHRKTGQRCILVDPKTGEPFDLETSIKELELSPINLIPRISLPIINRTYIEGPVKRSEKEKMIVLPCFKKLLQEGESEGNRHYSYMLIIHKLWANGYTKEKSLEILLDYSKKCIPIQQETEVERQFNFQWDRCERGYAYHVGCNGSGLISQILTKHCSDLEGENCKRHKQQKPDSTDEFNFEGALDSFVDKHKSSLEFLKIQPLIYDETRNWWLWSHKEYKWIMCDEIDILNKVDRALGYKGFTLTSKERSEIIDVLKRKARDNPNRPKPMPKTWVQFKNKIVDIETGEIIKDASPDYFSTNPICWEIGESDQTPTIDKLFKDWVGEEWMQTLYEMVAYSVIQDYPIHRIFALCGSGSNGKSKFLEILTKFVGQENRASIEIERLLNSRFECVKLYKKLVAIAGETNFGLMVKTGLIKRLAGEDVIGFEFKGKNGFDDYNCAKIFIATNSLPPTADKTIGFYRRWLIIDFPNQFTDGRDVLKDIPEHEYNNLARKCIKIVRNLLDKGKFHGEGDIDNRMKRYEEKSNPLMRFINDKFIKDVNSETVYSDFYSGLETYLEELGLRKMSAIEVTKLLKNEGFSTKNKTVKIDKDRNSTFNVILGIKQKINHLKVESNIGNTDNTDFSLHTPYKRADINTDIIGITDITPYDTVTKVKELLRKKYNGSSQEFHKDVLKEIGAVEEQLEKWLKEGILQETSPGWFKFV